MDKVNASQLSKLLADRKGLREFCRQFETATLFTRWADVDAAEQCISTIVLAPLALHLRDQPGKADLARFMLAALTGFSQLAYLEQPERIFAAYPQVFTRSWHHAVRARILELVAPLDSLLQKEIAP
jgi:hypothetical protein